MTADDESAAADDRNERTDLANIPEDNKDGDTVNGEDMETEDAETTENSNLQKSHILIRFTGDGKQINVAFLMKTVLKWLF
jgi:hypothetical protein